MNQRLILILILILFFLWYCSSKDNMTNPNSIIPKIIHQTYKNYDLPPLYKKNQKIIKKLHPDFDYRFYTDEDMDDYIKTNFPQYYDKFNELPRKIMKIDMFRYFLMFKDGGLYTDMDYEMFKPFDLLEHNVVLPSNKENSNGELYMLGNAVFASKPNHPYWKSLMDTLFTIDRKTLNYQNDKSIDEGELGTGPGLVTNMWKKYNNKDIYTPKKNLFHPPSHTINVKKLMEKNTYGIHHCSGTWRNNKM